MMFPGDSPAARHVFLLDPRPCRHLPPMPILRHWLGLFCPRSQKEREEPALPLLFPPDDNRTALRAHPLFGFVLYIVPKYDAVFIRLFDHSQGF